MGMIFGLRFLAIAAAWALLAGGAAGQTKIRKVPAKATRVIEGKELYREFCAVCHGTDGKGGGPAAAALVRSPGDLTTIARLNNHKYPEIRIQRVVQGEDTVVAHGSRDMPVWGEIFRRTSANQDSGSIRVFNLVKYIESIQVE
jgi:mono/diheme cytochrome c family protein